MPQSLAKVLIHIVYSTKGRHPWLEDAELRRQLYAYKATILREKVDTPALVIGGVADHIHALCLLSRKFAIKDVIEEAKNGSRSRALSTPASTGNLATASSP